MRVILLPGLDGTGELLAEFAAALAPEFDPSVLPYPPDRVLDYPQLTAWVRERLPRDEPFALVAESYSGPVALALAAERPADLVGVVLCASFAKAPRPRWGPLLGLMPLAALGRLPLILLMPLLMGRWSSRRWAGRVHAALRGVAPAVLRQRLRDVTTVDLASCIGRIACPLLYLRASRDRLVGADNWQLIRDASRHAVCIEIEGPHFLLQAKPRECAAAIKR